MLAVPQAVLTDKGLVGPDFKLVTPGAYAGLHEEAGLFLELQGF